jgi:hypothetical protein
MPDKDQGSDEGLVVSEDVYPTEEELAKVAAWPWQDPRGLLAYVKEKWWAADWGWAEGRFEEYGRKGHRYRISTAGWSGNEDLINALHQNRMFWSLCWFSSQRGGHYEFRVSGDASPLPP